MAASNSKIVYICLILSLGGSTNSFTSMGIMDIKDVLQFGFNTMSDILESWEIMHPKEPGYHENIFSFVYQMEGKLKNSIFSVSEKIEAYQKKMEIHIDAMVAKLLNDLPLQEKLDHNLRTIDQYVGQINDLYNNFVMYVMAIRAYERYTLEDFARTCVSSRWGALPDLLKSIHRLLVPRSDTDLSTSVLVLLANQMQEASSQICSEHQSLQQLLYNLYTTVTLTEIKGYSMIQFSYMLLRLYNPGTNFTKEMELIQDQYLTRTSETVRAVKTAMAFAPRDVWRCDAKTHNLDETYTKLTQLFQGYVVNEVDLNSGSTCRETCGYYGYSKVYGCYKNLFCARQRKCNGKIVHCEYIDSDMWICPSPKDSDRRYEYIQYENGRVFGKKNTCQGGTTKVDSWWRWLFWHCSYCFCYCDDRSANSDRYFSLRKVMSDVANNKVITGIALKKVNQIVHLQIQEGELVPKGNINGTTVSWKPVEAFSILDSNITNDVDYHTLAWEKRGVDLDDLVPAQDHLLTGVRFRTIGSHLNLEIMVTPFNFTTGKLIQPLEKSFWLSNDLTNRTELKLKNPDIPIRAPLPAMPDSKANQYLNFGPSNRENDAAQNTIPFLDIQPVETRRPVPIAGAGIFHKGGKGSGGFLALKLITYDFTPHLKVDLLPEPPVIHTSLGLSEIKAV